MVLGIILAEDQTMKAWMRTACGVLLAVSLPACSSWESRSTLSTSRSSPPKLETPGQPAIGEAAPEIEGEDIDGKPFKLSDYRGKVVMLDFWGNW
jgi:cytochrome oxidase Cu insertion factor (SCO1/SenC/PrrC family)